MGTLGSRAKNHPIKIVMTLNSGLTIKLEAEWFDKRNNEDELTDEIERVGKQFGAVVTYFEYQEE